MMSSSAKPASNQAFKAFVDASAGAMGALFAAVLLYPLDVVKTRQQASVEESKTDDDERVATEVIVKKERRDASMWWQCVEIYRAEGVEGLFAGLSSKVAHTLFASFAYFYWYATLKQMAERRSGKSITTGMNLIVAAVAGALNMSMTLPLEMINTRAQIQPDEDEEEEGDQDKKKQAPVHHKSMWELAQEIYAEDGLLSFWKGYIPSLVLVSNPSINFTLFDKLKLRMQLWKQKRVGAKRLVALTAFEAFVIAAIAKAVATVLTYPVIRAKVLMQAQKKHIKVAEGSGETSSHHAHQREIGDSMVDVLRNIGQLEGLPGYFKGCSTQLFNTVIKSALLLMTKEQIYTFTMRVLYLLRRDKPTVAVLPAAKA